MCLNKPGTLICLLVLDFVFNNWGLLEVRSDLGKSAVKTLSEEKGISDKRSCMDKDSYEITELQQ